MKYILAFSGGKDSTYLLYELLKRKMPLDEIVFYDCGLEFPEVYEWLEYIEEHFGVKITRYPPREGFSFNQGFHKIVKSGVHKGEKRGFPRCSQKGCWISRDAKVRNRKKHKEDRVYIAYTSDEKRRIQVDENLIYPLIDWGIDSTEVVNRLKRLQLTPPYYKRGFTRGGCWLCPKQSLNSLYLLWELHPNLWEELRLLEGQSPHGFKLNTTLDQLEKKFRERKKQTTLEEATTDE